VAIKGDGAEDTSRYVAGMAANLIDVKNFEESEWTQVGLLAFRVWMLHGAAQPPDGGLLCCQPLPCKLF
jgi:hypothetical protein